jgi:hypothetical protein
MLAIRWYALLRRLATFRDVIGTEAHRMWVTHLADRYCCTQREARSVSEQSAPRRQSSHKVTFSVTINISMSTDLRESTHIRSCAMQLDGGYIGHAIPPAHADLTNKRTNKLQQDGLPHCYLEICGNARCVFLETKLHTCCHSSKDEADPIAHLSCNNTIPPDVLTPACIPLVRR